MNYYQARKREGDGRWRYTQMRDRKVWAIGYCSLKKLCPVCNGNCGVIRPSVVCENCDNTGLVPNDTDCSINGHATQQEAENCYAQYLIDTTLSLDNSYGGHVKYKCLECDEFTNKFASIGRGIGQDFVLCDSHRNKENVLKHWGRPSYSMGSY